MKPFSKMMKILIYLFFSFLILCLYLKILSLGNFNIETRQDIARQMSERSVFAYRKWELLADHAVFQEIEQHFESEHVMLRLEELLDLNTNDLIPTLKDMFVTNYDTNDFLNAHNDYYAGTFAFVASLTDGPEWREDWGGELVFECEASTKPKPKPRSYARLGLEWCETVSPSFNTLVLFHTKTPGYSFFLSLLHSLFPSMYLYVPG